MDITSYLNRSDILEETARQIIKDFGCVGQKVVFSENTQIAYRELYRQIFSIIEKMFLETPHNFYNLIYRIDINEIQIQKAVEKAKDKPFAEIVTELILKRELQKVLFRKIFSK